jgi:hypothetical protein
VGTDSAFGHLLTYLLVVLPLGWVLFKAAFSKARFFSGRRRFAPTWIGEAVDHPSPAYKR